MPDTTVKFDADSLELAQLGMIEAAERDAEKLVEHLRYLREESWPVLDARVDDAQTAYTLLRQSMGAIDLVGWPDTHTWAESVEAHLGKVED